jgi:hypothetical protein
MTVEPSVATVKGPKGSADIFEIWSDGRLIEYEVHFQGKVEKCVNIGEAYILAGDKVGVPT